MGLRGPIPKKPSQRRRKSAEPPATKGSIQTTVKQPRIRADIHPLARTWYKSLAKSGQAEFYTASDWATALVAAEALNDYFAVRKAALLAEFNHMASALLVAEGDRRRARIELERPKPDEERERALPAYLEDYRRIIRAEAQHPQD